MAAELLVGIETVLSTATAAWLSLEHAPLRNHLAARGVVVALCIVQLRRVRGHEVLTIGVAWDMLIRPKRVVKV